MDSSTPSRRGLTAASHAISASLARPSYHRSILLRRLLSASLALAALVVGLQSWLHQDPPTLVFAHDIPVGHEVTEADLRSVRLPADVLPDTRIDQANDAVGQVTVAGVAAGEVVTTQRLNSPRVTADFASLFPGEIQLVPVRLADPSSVAMLHHGDAVSVVAAPENPAPAPMPDAPEPARPAATVIADYGRVVVADPANPDSILLAVAAEEAYAVASASLAAPVGVVLAAR